MLSVQVQRQGKKKKTKAITQLKLIRQKEIPPLLVGGSAFLFYMYSDLQLMGWGPPTLGRTICFTQSTNSNVNLIQKHPHGHTQGNVGSKVWERHGPVKLTHKVNHHGVAPGKVRGGGLGPPFTPSLQRTYSGGVSQ